MTESYEPPEAAPSLRARATRGTILTLGGQLASQGLRLVSNLVLTRLLFPEAFGLMALVSLVMIAIEQIINLGTQSTVIRHDRGDERSFLDTAWTIQVVRSVIVWLAISALSPLIADFYHEPQLTSLLPVGLFSLVVANFSSMKLALLYRRLEFGRRIAIDLVTQAVAIVVMVVLAWIYHSVWSLVAGGMINQLVRTVLSHVWIPGPRDRFAWDRESARELLSFGKWVFISSGLSFLANQLDVAILGRLVPLAELGVYTIAMTLPNLLRELLGGLSGQVLMPALSEANRESGPAFRRAYEASRHVVLPTAVVTTLVAVIVAPAFFGILYDSRYSAATWIAQLGALRLWFGYLQVNACFALFAYGDARIWAVSSGVATVLTFIGCLVGFHVAALPGLVVGLAFGTAAGYVVPAVQLARLGIASPRLELGYTALVGALALASLAAEKYTAHLLPDLVPGLHMLVCGSVIAGPFALWSAGRVWRAIRLA